MAALNEYDPDLLYADDDPLVRRLRTLEWAEAPEEVRQRCWERFSARIAELAAEDAESNAARMQGSRVEERYGFSRRRQTTRESVAHAWRSSTRAPATYGRSAHSVALSAG
jgi:hypothetical protein